MTEEKSSLRRAINMPRYLSELSILAGREVFEGEISKPEDALSFRALWKGREASTIRTSDAPFQYKESPEFSQLVKQLIVLNSAPIFVWTPRTEDCGLFKLPSLDEVNFRFPFDLNQEGIVVFATTDGRDRMLVEFSKEDGRQLLELEVTGEHWGNIKL